jgi:hypothetical protein
MALIQAITRKKKYEINIIAHSAALVFLPNDKGDVVCDVADADARDWLLAIPASFRPYGEQADEPISTLLTAVKVEELPPPTELPVAPVEELPPAGSAYVLKNGETEFDLRPLTDAELHDFAKANGIKVHHKAKGDAIRDKIVDALTAEG